MVPRPRPARGPNPLDERGDHELGRLARASVRKCPGDNHPEPGPAPGLESGDLGGGLEWAPFSYIKLFGEGIYRFQELDGGLAQVPLSLINFPEKQARPQRKVGVLLRTFEGKLSRIEK